MKKIVIKHEYMSNKLDVVDRINEALKPFGIEIVLKEWHYDDNQVYRTGERALDSRLDRTAMPV